MIGSLNFSLNAFCLLLKTQGSVVNVSSLAGLHSYAQIMSYCMSKSALDCFTKCLAIGKQIVIQFLFTYDFAISQIISGSCCSGFLKR